MRKRYLRLGAEVYLSGLPADGDPKRTRKRGRQVPGVLLVSGEAKASADKGGDWVLSGGGQGGPRGRSTAQPPPGHSQKIDREQIYRVMLLLRRTLQQKYQVIARRYSLTSPQGNHTEIRQAFSEKVT